MFVNIESLINSFDLDQDAAPHSSALKNLAGEELGFALLSDYFVRKKGASSALRLPGACTPGIGRQGPWLDGWFAVRRGAETVHYQTEVKMWSFHGVGPDGGPLAATCTLDDLFQFQTESWQRYWVDGTFANPKLAKVLVRMTPRPNLNIASHEPLACLWSPLHPVGCLDPLFSVNPANREPFDRLWIFSMSTYLRGLLHDGLEQVQLDLPITETRLRRLKDIFQAE